MKSKFKVYVKIISLVFLAIILQVTAMAEVPPKLRAQKGKVLKELAIVRSMSRIPRRMEFFPNNMNNMNDEFKNNIDVRFRKVMIIDPKKKETNPIPNKQASLEEIGKASSDFISSVELKRDELSKLNDAA